MDPINNNSATANYDFKNPINQAEDEGEDDCEVPGELDRLLLQEERAIQPHKEPVESVNLGTDEDGKEVKIGANLEPSVKHGKYRCYMTMLRSSPGHMKTCLG